MWPDWDSDPRPRVWQVDALITRPLKLLVVGEYGPYIYVEGNILSVGHTLKVKDLRCNHTKLEINKRENIPTKIMSYVISSRNRYSIVQINCITLEFIIKEKSAVFKYWARNSIILIFKIRGYCEAYMSLIVYNYDLVIFWWHHIDTKVT